MLWILALALLPISNQLVQRLGLAFKWVNQLVELLKLHHGKQNPA